MPADKKRKPLSPRERKMIDNIRRARRSKELSQEELSIRLHRNSNYMGMVESYRRGLSFKTLFKIANVLDVKTTIFFEGI